MFSIWISEQTAIIPLYSINRSRFITETECVYCAVRTTFLNIIKISLSVVGFKKVVSRKYLTRDLFIFTNAFYETSLQFFYKVTELVNRIKSASQQHVTSSGKDGGILCWRHVQN